ncbi:MAG TPA: DUF998 domain-containing protein [Cryptosporangiaceae bacterium]|nr:DUF998 domain-containing protein [Cryptosporangiaceae bacterium]
MREVPGYEATTGRGRLWWPSAAGLMVFVGGATVAGAVNPGYSHRRDFLSALAGLGAESRWIGVLALTGLAVFHLGAALWTTARARAAFRGVAVFLFVAGLAGLVVAASPITCARGAARCAGPEGGPAGWTDTVHSVGVVVYEVALVGAMLTLAWVLWRGARRWALALGSVAFAVASGWTFVAIGPPDHGAWQRVWLAVNITWVLLVLVTNVRPVSRRRDTRPTLGEESSATRP